MVSKAYRATRVNDVDWERLARGNEGVNITLGIDVGERSQANRREIRDS
jgi:hypothetical protein